MRRIKLLNKLRKLCRVFVCVCVWLVYKIFNVFLLKYNWKINNAMMALKMLYRGPSSRLENLIEKIQATKEITNNGK